MLIRQGDTVVALVGNPNVGKSTIFNALTGLRQHTGNWAGKTVDTAFGRCSVADRSLVFVDLPGTYSLLAKTPEEEISRDFITSGKAAATIVVCDATCLERTLLLAMQTLELTNNVIICVNLVDEAAKSGLEINAELLSERLGTPVVTASARNKSGMFELLAAIDSVVSQSPSPRLPDISKDASNEQRVVACLGFISDICNGVIVDNKLQKQHNNRRFDRFVTNKYAAFPIMLAMLLAVLWITIVAANYPSQLLSNAFSFAELWITQQMLAINIPNVIILPVMEGMFRTVGWVVSVMLPPMAIFFPLFTIFEDFGLLPRFAFNMDYYFKKCCACGKQGLTMCLGLGCNAAGVVGCRIIDSKRERLIAILTNAFIPCNGRFPSLLLLVSVAATFFGFANIFSGLTALALLIILVVCIMSTFLVSKLLGKTILAGQPSAFTLELPPYRKPQFGTVLIRSVFDRTLFVLSRAVVVALPAGLLIWILANITVDGASLLSHSAAFLDPFARHFGLDGVILLAFILGLPANEIVVPIIIMGYVSTGSLGDIGSFSQLFEILTASGWSWVTALSTMLFVMFHFPCSTALLTIYKETRSIKWTLLSAALPTIYGLLLCYILNIIIKLFVF